MTIGGMWPLKKLRLRCISGLRQWKRRFCDWRVKIIGLSRVRKI